MHFFNEWPKKIRYIDNRNLFSLHITLLNVAPQALTLTHTFNPVSSMSAHCLEVTPNDLQYLEAFFLLLQCLLPNPLVSVGRRRKTKSSTKFYMTSGRVWPKSWLINHWRLTPISWGLKRWMVPKGLLIFQNFSFIHCNGYYTYTRIVNY